MALGGTSNQLIFLGITEFDRCQFQFSLLTWHFTRLSVSTSKTLGPNSQPPYPYKATRINLYRLDSIESNPVKLKLQAKRSHRKL